MSSRPRGEHVITEVHVRKPKMARKAILCHLCQARLTWTVKSQLDVEEVLAGHLELEHPQLSLALGGSR